MKAIQHIPSGFPSKFTFLDSSPLPTVGTQNGQASNQGTSNGWASNQISLLPVTSDIAGWTPELVMSVEMSFEPSSSMPASTSQAQPVAPETSHFVFSSGSKYNDEDAEESEHSSVGRLEKTPLNGSKNQTTFSSGPRELENAPSGRSYRQWGESGTESTSAWGALIPDGYQKFDNAELPWICPIRSCRALFAGRRNLGNHFHAAHRALCLNDNLDGTLSETGAYGERFVVTKDPSRKSKPAIVVSRGQKSLYEDPMVEPKASKWVWQLRQGKPDTYTRPTNHDSLSDPADDIPMATRRRMLGRTAAPISALALSVPPTSVAPNWNYTTWLDSSGQHIDTSGALLPRGYKLDESLADRPWICPVRSCRRLYRTSLELGGHFQCFHQDCLFNDNGDGTLSIVGALDESRGDRWKTTMKNLQTNIVTANALNQTEAPMLAPQKPIRQYSGYGNYLWVDVFEPRETPQNLAPSSPQVPSRTSNVAQNTSLAVSVPQTIHQQSVSHPSEAWDYVRDLVPSAETHLQHPTVMELIRLPIARTLEWASDRDKTDFVQRNHNWRDVVGILQQLTGVEAEPPCTACRQKPRPWVSCVWISTNVQQSTIKTRFQCANCLAEGSHLNHNCSSKHKAITRAATAATTAHVSGPLLTKTHPSKIGTPYTRSYRKGTRRTTTKTIGRPRSGRAIPTAKDNAKHSTFDLTRRTTSQTPQKGYVDDDDDVFMEDAPEPQEPRRALDPPPASQRLVSADQNPSRSMKQMFGVEEWEMAPGRIRSAGATGDVNIAFSQAYLTGSLSRQITSEHFFAMSKIGAGSVLNLPALFEKTQICMLTTGKLLVRLDDEPQFAIGSHGLFVVRPGVTARIENRLYEEAILHIITSQE